MVGCRRNLHIGLIIKIDLCFQLEIFNNRIADVHVLNNNMFYFMNTLFPSPKVNYKTFILIDKQLWLGRSNCKQNHLLRSTHCF